MAVILVAAHMSDALTSAVAGSSLRVIGDHRQVDDTGASRKGGRSRQRSRR
ncbi:hypothetical protein H7I53_16970 [Mycolicibacterium pulveris]|uniref:hypothetical protein n=1 Tax=Mycolicibacterium pulveris TaxID=36813 RepID=UPI0013D0B60B|nr:hypothetical protein [Mycolicibacterium pulveris]MCV6981908.1 hypothetical protein [Mycolicibacterium pulveris]